MQGRIFFCREKTDVLIDMHTTAISPRESPPPIKRFVKILKTFGVNDEFELKHGFLNDHGYHSRYILKRE